MDVHPLIFEPIFKPKVWGGRKFAALDKQLPPDQDIGESWECADLPDDQSTVAAGPSRGMTLGRVLSEWGPKLTGRASLAHGRFPLLIKFLDAREPLSIQVHPGDASHSAAIKHEAWYVIDAEPDAVIYCGLRPGVTRDQLRAAAGTRGILDLVQTVPARRGYCIYCPGGTVHALGGGLLVAEVQTPSDVTYRLYDWERRRPAEDAGLHVEEALAAVEWDPPPQPAPQRRHSAGVFATVSHLLKCPAFQIEKVRFVEGVEQDMPYAEMVIWIVLEGRGAVFYGKGESIPFARGQVVVLPADLRGRLRTDAACVWLEVTVPVSAPVEALRDAGEPVHAGQEPSQGVVPLGISIARGPKDQ